MLKTVIPALISGLFTVIPILLGQRFMTDPTQTAKAKLELINMLPESARKAEMQNEAEVLAHWTIMHGDTFVAIRKSTFWIATSVALFIMTGSITILSYIALHVDASIGTNGSIDLPKIGMQFGLILEHIKWTFGLMTVPVVIGAIGFGETSISRTLRIRKLKKLTHASLVDDIAGVGTTINVAIRDDGKPAESRKEALTDI